MLSLKDFIDVVGLDLTDDVTKLVRHKSSEYDLNKLFIHNFFELYQSIQKEDRFVNCKYLISFVGLDNGKAGRSKLIGVYEIKGVSKTAIKSWPEDYPFRQMEIGNYQYKLEEVEGFEDLKGRLIIDWGKALQSWHQWLKNEKEVTEILPKGYVKPFPGYLDILIDHKELEEITGNPDANREWFYRLSSVAAIYIIKDNKTKKLYVGSASGSEGLWGRWKNYAQNGHGGNKMLKALHANNLNHKYNFEYSIVRVLPKKTPNSELKKIEQLYKNKLGSLDSGLNLS